MAAERSTGPTSTGARGLLLAKPALSEPADKAGYVIPCVQPLEASVPIDISKLSATSRWQIAMSRADPDRINRHTTAKILGVTIRTLQRWHNDDFSPKRHNDPHLRPIWYNRAEVEQWAASNGYAN